jgi:hypothetical protein
MNGNGKPMMKIGNLRGDSDMSAAFIRILLQQLNCHNEERFIRRLVVETAPDVQCRLYGFFKLMACAWAGQMDLSREDAALIEDCKKICDVMGWQPVSLL